MQGLCSQVAPQYTFEDMLAREDVSVPESIAPWHMICDKVAMPSRCLSYRGLALKACVRSLIFASTES